MDARQATLVKQIKNEKFELSLKAILFISVLLCFYQRF